MKDRIYLSLLALLGILLLFTCNSNPFECSKPVIKSDTIITAHTYTIWAHDTIIKFKYKTINKPTIVYLDPKHDTLSDKHVCDSIRIYNQNYNDSNLIIYNTDTIKGSLLGQNVRYTLKIPIKIIDSVFVKIHEKEPNLKRKIFVGVVVQGYPIQPHIGPIVSYLDKHDRMFHLQYDIVTGGILGGYSMKLSNPFKR